MGEEACTAEKLTGGNGEGRSFKGRRLGVAVLVGVGSEQVMFKQRCERSVGNDALSTYSLSTKNRESDMGERT